MEIALPDGTTILKTPALAAWPIFLGWALAHGQPGAWPEDVLVEGTWGLCTVPDFARDNAIAPDVLEPLLSEPVGEWVRCGIGGGWSEPYRLVRR